MFELLPVMSVISFLLAGALGTAALVLWLEFDIPGVIGEQSQRPARRAGRRIRRAGGRAAEDVTEQLENIMVIHTEEELTEGEEEK